VRLRRSILCSARNAKLIPIAVKSNPRIFLSAGEASGDHYGAQIIAELRRRLPGASFSGLGGGEMEAAGQARVVRAEDVAHMGITEVIRHMPYIFTQYRKLVASIQRERPEVAVLIDFPDVNFRLAKHCKRLGIPVLWFVSPQLWAWKRRRLRWVQHRVSKMLVIFPFEEEFYRNRGVDAEFVGHPLAALPLPTISREDYARESGIDPAKQWIALLPGSRKKEIKLNLPLILEAADDLSIQLDCEFLLPVASTVPREWIEEQMRFWTNPVDRNSEPRRTNVHLVSNARASLYHSRAAIVASGTATVQALKIGNPFVVVYRVSRLTFALAKRLVRYPAEIPSPLDEDGNLPIAMVNLIAGRRIVPELLNERFTAENLAAALRPLLDDTPKRAQMVADLAEARAKLLPPGESGVGSTPIERVCEVIEKLLTQFPGEQPESAP
jgi:lipid-A-disaccharide synthase